MYATRALGGIGKGSTNAVPTLIQALQDPDPAVRRAAVFALGKVGKGAVPTLIQALQNPDPEVRFSTARILGSIGKNAVDAVPALIQLLQEHDPEDRGVVNSWTIPRVAAEALEKIDTPEARKAVEEHEKLQQLR